MARWTSRGLDKFLTTDFGLPYLKEGGDLYRFVGSGTRIFCAVFIPGTGTVKIRKYDIRENLPWQEVTSHECGFPKSELCKLIDINIYDENVFCVFSRGGTFIVDFLVYSIAEDEWTTLSDFHPGLEDNFGDQIFRCRSQDRLFILSLTFEAQRLFSEADETYPNDSHVPSNIDLIHFKVFHFPTRRWTVLSTRLVGFFKADARHLWTTLTRGLPATKDSVLGCHLAEQNSVYLFPDLCRANEMRTNDVFVLNLKTKKWSRIQMSGDIPPEYVSPVVLRDYIYSYGGPSQADIMRSWTIGEPETKSIFRFDTSTCRWNRVEAAGRSPTPRWDPFCLIVDGKIVVLGFGLYLDLDLLRLKNDDFWFCGNNYKLGCKCDYCWEMKLTKEHCKDENASRVAQEAAVEAKDVRSSDHLLPVAMPKWISMAPELSPEEDNDVLDRFEEWLEIQDPFPRLKFGSCGRSEVPDPVKDPRLCYDLHVFDLSPSLKTLALTTIADHGLDTSKIPPNLHLNLNTMYAFDNKARNMRSVTSEERKLLLYGRGDFRRHSYQNLAELGLYDGSLLERFKWERFVGKPEVVACQSFATHLFRWLLRY